MEFHHSFPHGDIWDTSKRLAIPFFLAISGLIGAILTTIGTVLSTIIDLPATIACTAWAPIPKFNQESPFASLDTFRNPEAAG